MLFLFSFFHFELLTWTNDELRNTFCKELVALFVTFNQTSWSMLPSPSACVQQFSAWQEQVAA